MKKLNKMRLGHVNLVARDADRLAAFYTNVFRCTVLRAPRLLRGEGISRGNGLPNSEIYSIWLKFPDSESPFLEIHQHGRTLDRTLPRVNEPGFGHLSFEADDIESALAAVLAYGGAKLGEVTNLGSTEGPYLCVYARDPEGNILEFEQPTRSPPASEGIPLSD